MRCLELGCGTGEFTERLVASGCELVAVDLSEETAALARERVGDRARVVVGNIETGEGLEGLEFDAIVGVSVLHHVDLDATFAHTFSLLRPGGRFAFSEPNMANPQVWAERNLDLSARLRHVTPHETAFRADELRRRFEEEDLVVDVCEPFEFLHPSTPAWLVPAALSSSAASRRPRCAGSPDRSGSPATAPEKEREVVRSRTIRQRNAASRPNAGSSARSMPANGRYGRAARTAASRSPPRAGRRTRQQAIFGDRHSGHRRRSSSRCR